ncbi:MAG: hemin uptake protein HemP [Acidovorax sp.]
MHQGLPYMHAATLPAHAFSSPALHGQPEQPLPLADLPAGAMDSSELLKGQKAVTIVHNGALYRLQATKLGKLILTK